MRKIIRLTEAKRWMSLDERKLKKLLIRLLRDDGHGHHHSKYADRLADFDINIIPNKPNEPPVTASISFKTGVINIGEGLINNPNTYYQLPTVLRHEMAHNLMMHEIRMLRKIGAQDWEIWGESPSLHKVLNWIEDYEISNEKYIDYDKEIMRKLIINGRAIPCLVTEDHREDWKTLSVEEMYEKMVQELEAMHDRLRQQMAIDTDDSHAEVLLDVMMGYRNIDTNSLIPGTLETFVNSGCKLRDGDGRLITIAEPYQQIAKNIYNSLQEQPADPDDIERILREIADSKPTVVYRLINPTSGEIIIDLKAPEAKAFAVEVLKKYRTDYTAWYRKVISLLATKNYSPYEIKKIYKAMKG